MSYFDSQGLRLNSTTRLYGEIFVKRVAVEEIYIFVLLYIWPPSCVIAMQRRQATSAIFPTNKKHRELLQPSRALMDVDIYLI
jgi:hypothetical protein